MTGKASAPTAPHGKTASNGPRTSPGATQLPPPKAAPDETAIRTRAYTLWEQAGHPEGDGVEFWLRAERELTKAR